MKDTTTDTFKHGIAKPMLGDGFISPKVEMPKPSKSNRFDHVTK